MVIIRRYFLREFFKLFSIIALGLGLISSLMELVDKIEGFMQQNPSVGVLMQYSALNIPRYLVYLMPASALISGLFVFGQAGKRKETVAIKAAGGSMKGLLIPFVITGVCLCVTGLLLSEVVAPDFMKRANRIRDSLTKKETALTVKEGVAWLRAKEYIVRIGLFLPDKGIIRDISLMKVQDDMLTERIEAESGEWLPLWEEGTSKNEPALRNPQPPGSGKGTWMLKGVTVYDIKAGSVTRLGELRSGVVDTPDILGKGTQKPEEMSARELLAYSTRLKEAGIRNTKLLVDIHARFSYPLINLIMLVVGVSLATGREIKSGLVTTAIGLSISLVYWLTYTAALSLGYAGILPPVIAAWLVPLVFGAVSVYLFTTIPE